MRKFKIRPRRERLLIKRYGKFFSFAKFLAQSKWVILAILALGVTIYPFVASKNLPPNILVKKRIFLPGQTIRIIADDTRLADKLYCRFKNRTHPFFKIDATKARALTGVSLTVEPSVHELEIILKNKVLKKIPVLIIDPKTKPIELKIADFKLQERKHPNVKKELEIIRQVISVTTPNQIWEGVFELPANAKFSAPFGQKRLLPDNSDYFHTGLDIAVVENTPVLASADGVVAYTGDFILGGKSLYINHGQGVFSMYCHLNNFLVGQGESIKKGQVIAKSGNTGFSNSPHLHWSVYVGGLAVDPLQWNKEVF